MKRWQILAIALPTLGLTVAMVFYRQLLFPPAGQTTTNLTETQGDSSTEPLVTALGRLEPQGEVIDVAPNTVGTRAFVRELRVQLGQQVQTGDIIAVLGSNEARQAAVVEAQQQVATARARLDQVKAGAKQGDIKAQKATIARLQAKQQGDVKAQEARIARLEAELKNATEEAQRYQELYDEGGISLSELEARQTSLATGQERVREAETILEQIQTAGLQEIRQAEADLERLQEIRPVDIALAEEELQAAITAVQAAQVDLEQTYVKAPLSGQILQIYTQPGEIVSDRGLVALGQTEQMYAIAEVYETDINRVQVGQTAAVRSEYGGFEGTLQGVVEEVGLRVHRNNLIESAPGAPTDTRIIETKIKLEPEDSQKVSALTDLQVRISIHSD